MWVVVLCLAIGGGIYARRAIAPRFQARNKVEFTITVILIICSTIAIFTTIGIVLSVLFESIRFFNRVPITEFLFGLKWSPQTALRADQVAAAGAFGAVPLFTGTLLISLVAMLVAVPIGLLSALYLSEYAHP
jgi:phosphate transport system permease protein